MMVFLDTCIWIELCGVKTPVKSNEIRQAHLASELFKNLLDNNENIITCHEQLVEIISAIEKIKLREHNRAAKDNKMAGCGDLKEFRKVPEFSLVKEVCKAVISDVVHFAKINNCQYSIEDILDKINLADINDCIYFDYCRNNGIEFYSFDSDISNFGYIESVHILKNN